MPDRPGDDDLVPILDALAWQMDHCRSAGSPVSTLVLEAVHDDLAAAGPLSSLIPPLNRFGTMPGLRVMAAVHRLALDRRAPRVALSLPTMGGTPPPDPAAGQVFAAAVVDSLVSHPDELLESLAHTPQTNETGRATLLRVALSRLDPTLPVRLREVGSSAGLNLRADHLPGDPGLEAGPLPPVTDRLGCDLHPVDPLSTEGRLLLTSYVWVDDLERFERLRSALEVAATVPARVVRADAVDFVLGIEPQHGATTVLWHSAMWMYLTAGTRRRLRSAVASLGSRASSQAPVVHVSWEWDPAGSRTDPFSLVTRTWDGSASDGSPWLLARGSSHGQPTALVPGGPVLLADDPLDQ